MIKVEIDENSGFCFGVTTAIKKAEEELKNSSDTLYCLGDIVHNGIECERLKRLGLVTIDHEEYRKLRGAKVLLRAHGEPPETYSIAKENNLQLIDATCPVVLKLQQRIKQKWESSIGEERQIVIYGQSGHAEVLGLVGQTHGNAIVVESPAQIEKLDKEKDTCLYSQTTKSLEGYRQLTEAVKEYISPEKRFESYDTVCRQVANRMPHIREFASRHDVILFVCGKKSSNGRVLFSQCLDVNPQSYMIDTASEVDPSWLQDCNSVGICGATSTPKWLMEECKVRIQELLGCNE